jgi:hypothetical protein
MIVLAVGALDPVWATLILSVCVLLAGTVLSWKALGSDTPEVAKQVFAVVGVLFGLLAAGGLGTLFAHSSAETAENAAASAGTAAATEVQGAVEEQVEEAIKAPPPQGSGGR